VPLQEESKEGDDATAKRTAKKRSPGAGACGTGHLGGSVDMLMAAAITADLKTGPSAKKRGADSLLKQVQDVASGLGGGAQGEAMALPRHCLRILEAFRILNQLYEVVHTSHMETLTVKRICQVRCDAAAAMPRHVCELTACSPVLPSAPSGLRCLLTWEHGTQPRSTARRRGASCAGGRSAK
jgi:hypothetical protein